MGLLERARSWNKTEGTGKGVGEFMDRLENRLDSISRDLQQIKTRLSDEELTDQKIKAHARYERRKAGN